MAVSASRWRSWHSSSNTVSHTGQFRVALQPLEQHAGGDHLHDRARRRPAFAADREADPARRPRSPSSQAIRRAAARAAIRRGSATSTRWTGPSSSTPASASGTSVVLPVPGGAASTAPPRSSSAAASAGRTAPTGRQALRSDSPPSDRPREGERASTPTQVPLRGRPLREGRCRPARWPRSPEVSPRHPAPCTASGVRCGWRPCHAERPAPATKPPRARFRPAPRRFSSRAFADEDRGAGQQGAAQRGPAAPFLACSRTATPARPGRPAGGRPPRSRGPGRPGCGGARRRPRAPRSSCST